MKTELILDIRDRAAWLIINRPQARNTISPELIELLNGHLERIEADKNIGLVCLTGAGDEAFCSGMDLKIATDRSTPQASGRDYLAVLHKMRRLTKPILARVNGDCTGGGLGLISVCDLVYARAGARFAAPEARLGLFPLIMVPLILANVTRLKALEMFYSARLYAAAEAEEMGLITRSVPEVEFEDFINRTLTNLAGQSLTALRLGRPAINRINGRQMEEDMNFLAERLDELLATEDAAEGIRAFLEKRPPRWSGR